MPHPTPQLTFVTGGARSGKSAYAEAQARGSGAPVTYVATAQALDGEMTERIARHRRERPAAWHTLEEPLALPEALGALTDTETALVDCLSLWVSNLMLRGDSDEMVLEATDKLLAAIAARSGQSILVTNEVGFGIVPDNALARRYRDLLGWVNARCAAASGEAWLLVSGLPLRLKGGGE